MRTRRTEAVLAVIALLAFGPVARAQDGAPSATVDPAARREAGEAFRLGTKLVEEAKWAEALAAFERAERSVPHAITTFNIAACERAMGRYAAARATFDRALAEHAAGTTMLPSRLVEDAQAFRRESSELLARVRVTVAPRGARLEVDGRPLAARRDSVDGTDVVVLTAGTRPPGPGEVLTADTFVIEADPGLHVLRFSRDGASDGVVERRLASGTNPPIDLELRDLPATIQVAADQRGALVTLDGRDMGPAPISVLRPAGAHRVRVEREGFQPAEALLRVAPGESTTYRAKLVAEEPSVLEKWWFWTIAGAAVSGAVVGTYFLVDSDPQPTRPAAGGGSLGFRVPVP